MAEIKGKTSTGFSYVVDPQKVKDYRFMKAAAKAEANPIHTASLIEFLLGEEQEIKLMDHVEKDGFIDDELVYDEFKEILDEINNNKETKN